MSESRKGKKRSKSYYRKCAAGGKKARMTQTISAGMKGFLVTCNKYEKETVRETYNLLNEYADVMYGPELDNTKAKQSEDSDSNTDEEDMEKALAKETLSMKQVNSTERRFKNTETKCNNVIFIRTTVEDPCRLAHEIFRDIQEKQVQKARYAIRMLPVSAVCTPVPKDIEKTLRSVLAPHFETEFRVGIKYTAVCKIRNNNSVSKNTILMLLGKIIKEMNPQHQLCHDEPDMVIIVEVVQKACCFSVVKDYFKFKKYNLHEIIRKSEEVTESAGKEGLDAVEASIEKDSNKVDNETDGDVKKSNETETFKDSETDGDTKGCNEVADDTKEDKENEGAGKKIEDKSLGDDKTKDTENNEDNSNVKAADKSTEQECVELKSDTKDNSSDKDVVEVSD